MIIYPEVTESKLLRPKNLHILTVVSGRIRNACVLKSGSAAYAGGTGFTDFKRVGAVDGLEYSVDAGKAGASVAAYGVANEVEELVAGERFSNLYFCEVNESCLLYTSPSPRDRG